jgi:hypothetical protein
MPKQPYNFVEAASLKVKADLAEIMAELFNFFSEFRFKPAARFMDTLLRQPTVAKIKSYIAAYFILQNSPDAESISEKMESGEFMGLAAKIHDITNDYIRIKPEAINSRLVIYYGDPGTGKTHKAINENPEADVVACCSSITPDELLRVFDFTKDNDPARLGKPTFMPTATATAMTEGRTVILDEINMLPPDTLAFIQEITDNKPHIHHMNLDFNIRPGFKIIGTMNLVVNGNTISLPNPLVDRIAEADEFVLEPDMVTSMLLA